MVNLSIWEKESFFAPQDIVIIGAGLVGLWSALYLIKQNPKLKITLVDRGLVPTGASTRNAGFACFGSLGEVIHDAHNLGTDKMLQLVEMRFKGLSKIKKHFKDKIIDFELSGGFELYGATSGVSGDQLLENMDYINSLFKPITGSPKTYKRSDDMIPECGFGKTLHIVKNDQEGYLHPGKLVRALGQLVAGKGVQILNQIEILNLEESGRKLELKTNCNFSLVATQVLICTNGFAKDLLPKVDVVAVRGQILLTSPIENLPWKGTFHSEEGFYYFRNLGNKILLGGARNKAFDAETTTEMDTTNFIQNELETYLNEVVLPGKKGTYKIENRWAGIMAMGSDKMPICSEVSPGVFCAVRMSGMGVALSPVVGQTIAKEMLLKY
ncbi:MAG: FAD-dependent oxidoreductase [Flavisolibacter sp.]